MHQGQLALLQLFGHFVTSISVILDLDGRTLFASIIGSLIRSCYISCVLFIFILTLNRLVIMYNISYFACARKTFYTFLIALCYLITIFAFGFFLLPYFRLKYHEDLFLWYSTDYNDTISLIWITQSKSIVIILCISFAIHIVILVKIIVLRCITSKSIITLKELNFLIYAVLNFASCAFYELCIRGLYIRIHYIKYSSAILQLIYIFVSGSNTIYTVCFVRYTLL